MHTITGIKLYGDTDKTIVCEVTYNVTGNYRSATREMPEEFPDVEIVSIVYGCNQCMLYDLLSDNNQEIIDNAIEEDRETRNAFYEDGHADYLYEMQKDAMLYEKEEEG